MLGEKYSSVWIYFPLRPRTSANRRRNVSATGAQRLRGPRSPWAPPGRASPSGPAAGRAPRGCTLRRGIGTPSSQRRRRRAAMASRRSGVLLRKKDRGFFLYISFPQILIFGDWLQCTPINPQTQHSLAMTRVNTVTEPYQLWTSWQPLASASQPVKRFRPFVSLKPAVAGINEEAQARRATDEVTWNGNGHILRVRNGIAGRGGGVARSWRVCPALQMVILRAALVLPFPGDSEVQSLSI